MFKTDFALVTLPAPGLRQPAAPPPDPTDPRLLAFCLELDAARVRYHGIGIAAPQVGVALRIATIQIAASQRLGYGAYPDTPYTALLDPRVVDRSDALRQAPEGCLSVPGYEGVLWRPDRVIVESWDFSGQRIRIEGTGLFARCLQHEIDHLDGVLYVDRVERSGEVRRVETVLPGDPLFAHNPRLATAG